MATNQYFNNYNYTGTQSLMNDLVVEAIKAKGIDVNYLPREIINYDEIFGEGAQYTFANNFIIEMYPTNYETWGGQGDIFSKFGIQINDEALFIVSKTRFNEELSSVRILPQEGDLIYIPFSSSFMQIKKLEYDRPFWPQGANYVYEFHCELFNYAGEFFDQVANTEIQTTIAQFPVSDDEQFMPSDNEELQIEGDINIDNSENNPYFF